MVLGDWTIGSVAGATVTSENDSPTTNPTLKIAWGSTTGEIKAVPTGTTLNGEDITGIDSGKIEMLVKQNWATNNGSRVGVSALIRYTDENNYYRVKVRQNFGGTTNDSIVIDVVIGGVVTNIATMDISSFILTNTWFKFRIQWWSALGKIWFRVEYATTPFTSYTQIGSDISNNNDTHKGSSNKVGFAMSLDQWGSFGEVDSTWIEDFAVYRA